MKNFTLGVLAHICILLGVHQVAALQFPLLLDFHDYPSIGYEESGLSHADLNATVAQALDSCQIRDLLNGTNYRLISSRVLSPDVGLSQKFVAQSERFAATVYDYTNGRALLVNGIPFDNGSINIEDVNIQPHPSSEEILEAAQTAGIGSDEFVNSYMPPYISRDFPDGTSHRLLHLAINSQNSSRLVYVNMNNGTVEESASSKSQVMDCVAPQNSGQASVTRGAPGTQNLRITQSGKLLWTFRLTRPAASSGTNGGGIELFDVKYKGKKVLYKASVPILNVEYENKNSRCGPYYRDWQHEEYPLQCEGTNWAQWLRLCKTPAKTIVDPPNLDGGNFVGVAVYVDGLEVVLKSQMTAGWYRYTSEWRFHVDGTLRPRWGFGGVLNGRNCVCQVHHHHVYWRLDFDIVTAGNNLVREYNNPPIFANSRYHEKVYEIQRQKDPSRRRRWEISGRTGETYSLNPGPNDGTSDDFGVGDVWILKYRGNELDDGVGFTESIAARANINKFKNGERVKDTDVVIWYGAHFKHDQSHEGHDGGDHVVGPDIRLVKW
ncbi:copper amine oxidase [Bisporella sp. PMI_857]|nr:copper amine oxidase [Bisporella sp. PMI_857]